MIIIFADNRDDAFVSAARNYVEAHPAETVRIRNPRFYRPDQHEAADSIIIRTEFKKVAEAYERAGALVVRLEPGCEPVMSGMVEGSSGEPLPEIQPEQPLMVAQAAAPIPEPVREVRRGRGRPPKPKE